MFWLVFRTKYVSGSHERRRVRVLNLSFPPPLAAAGYLADIEMVSGIQSTPQAFTHTYYCFWRFINYLLFVSDINISLSLVSSSSEMWFKFLSH